MTARRAGGAIAGAAAALAVACGGTQGGAGRAAVDCAVAATAIARVAAQEDVVALARCARLGGLVVRSGAPLDLAALAGLVEVTGDVSIGPTLSLSSLSLPALQTIGGTLRISGNGALGGVLLPALVNAPRLELEHNAALTSAALPRLSRAERLAIRGNGELEVLTVSALVEVGELVIEGSPLLGLLGAEQLTRVTTWQVALPGMPAEEVAALRAKVMAPPEGQAAPAKPPTAPASE